MKRELTDVLESASAVLKAPFAIASRTSRRKGKENNCVGELHGVWGLQ